MGLFGRIYCWGGSNWRLGVYGKCISWVVGGIKV